MSNYYSSKIDVIKGRVVSAVVVLNMIYYCSAGFMDSINTYVMYVRLNQWKSKQFHQNDGKITKFHRWNSLRLKHSLHINLRQKIHHKENFRN